MGLPQEPPPLSNQLLKSLYFPLRYIFLFLSFKGISTKLFFIIKYFFSFNVEWKLAWSNPYKSIFRFKAEPGGEPVAKINFLFQLVDYFL